MEDGVNGRIFRGVLALVVKELKYRLDLVVNHLVHVVESTVMGLIFSLYHATLVLVVQVCY